MSVGEMTDQDFPDRPNYNWLQAHEDNSPPAEYRPRARHERAWRTGVGDEKGRAGMRSCLCVRARGKRTPRALDQVSGPWNGPIR
jgi:hypothetical protein